MTAGEAVARVAISAVWEALGGDPPRRGRARALAAQATGPDFSFLADRLYVRLHMRRAIDVSRAGLVQLADELGVARHHAETAVDLLVLARSVAYVEDEILRLRQPEPPEAA